MKKTFKKYFIPHSGNEYRPHVLRIEATLFMLSFILLFETLFLFQSFIISRNTNFLATIIESVLVNKTNINREVADIHPLTVNTTLEKAADLKAKDMASKGYFAHTSPDGKSPWYWLQKTGYSFTSAGENLAVNFIDSNDVMNAWMNSPTHRANILNRKYTEIGIGMARGMYKGREAIFVVQFFGKPVGAFAGTNVVVPPKTKPIGTSAPAATTSTLAQGKSVAVAGDSQNDNAAATSEESFIEVKNPIVEGISNTVPAVPTIKDNTRPILSVSPIKKALATPRVTFNYLLLVLGTIIALALMLKIFINAHIKHPSLIINGVAVLLLVSSLVVVNGYISLIGTAVL